MKKAGIFAAMLAVVVVFMQLYNYRLVGHMASDSYAVVSEHLADRLTGGVQEGEAEDIVLKKYEKSTAIYRRGSHLFAGDEKEKLDTGIPLLYVNDGQAVLNLSGDGTLVDTAFETLPVYEGLYVMDGMSFNSDREQADAEEFILISLGKQLYLNAQPVLISGVLGEKVIPENSIMYFGDDLVRYYSYEEGGMLSWHEMTGLNSARIQIGSMSCSWSEFLKNLNGISDDKNQNRKEKQEKESDPESLEQTETETLTVEESSAKPEILPNESAELEAVTETTAESLLESTESLRAAESLEGSTEPETKSSEAEEQKDQNDARRRKKGTEALEEGEIEIPEVPAETKKSKQEVLETEPSKGSGSKQESGSNSGSGSSGFSSSNEADGSGSSSGNSESGQNPSRPGESENSPENPSVSTPSDSGKSDPVYLFHMPTAVADNFQTGVYSISADVSFEDPDGRLVKGVRLAFYKGNSLYSRKLIRENGTVTVSPLEPDTEYYVEGYFDYYDENHNKQQYTFLKKTKLPKTKPLSYLRGIELTQNWSGKRYLDKMELEHISLKDAQTEDAEKETAIPYIDTMVCRVTRKGFAGSSVNIPVSADILRQLIRGEEVNWISSGILSSNSTYDYALELHDRFGNALVTVPEKVEGTVETCKGFPSASVRIGRESTVEKTIVNVVMTNPDDAEFPKDTALGSANPYLLVTTAAAPDTPIPLKVAGESELVSFVPVKGKGQTGITITNLVAGSQYLIQVRGSYDVGDENSYENVVIGTASYSTGRLTSLGSVNFNVSASDIKADSVQLHAGIRGSINTLLQPYLNKLVFSLEETENHDTTVYQVVLDKETLSGLILTGKETDITEQIRQTIGSGADRLPSDTKLIVTYPTADAELNVWDALFKRGGLDIRFESGLSSNTQYRAQIRALAKQDMDGAQEEDVTGRYYSNTFRTLRVPARVDISRWFVTDTYIDLRDLKVYDPDQAIRNKKISVRLMQKSNGKVLDIQNFTVDELNTKGQLMFSNLKKDMTYEIKFLAVEYNETFNSLNSRTLVELPIKNGTELATSNSIVFTTGTSLWGSIELMSLDSNYDDGQFTTSDDEENRGRNLFDINEAEFKQISDGGVITERTDNNGVISGMIPVTPGKMYQVSGGWDPNIFFFREDGTFLMRKNSSTYIWQLWEAPEGAAYARIRVPIRNLTTVCFMETDYDLNTIMDRHDNLLNGSLEGDYSPGYYVSNTGALVKNNGTTVSPYIPVKGNRRRYLKRNTQDVRAAYYDQNKKFISDASCNENGSMLTPKGAAYVRITINNAWLNKAYFGEVSEQNSGENLFDSSMVQEKGYYYDDKNVRRSGENYWYSKLIEVQPDAAYYANVGYNIVWLFDANRRSLGYINIGGNEQIFRTSPETRFIRVSGQNSFLNQETVRIMRTGPARAQNQQRASFHIHVEDPENYLAQLKKPEVQVVIQSRSLTGEENWETEHTESLPVTVGEDGKTEILDTDYLYMLGSGRKYRAVLQADLPQFDYSLQIDQEEVETSKKKYLIRSEAGFAAMTSDPFGDYLATKDITVSTNITQYFYGSVDFQGHQVTKVFGDRSTSARLFTAVAATGIVENLVYDLTLHPSSRAWATAGIAYENGGTIQNVIVHLNMDSQARICQFGGVCYNNWQSGVIENFAVVLDEDMVVDNESSPCVAYNSGIVRNGYVCADGDYRMKIYHPTDGSEFDKSRRGGIVGQNTATGTVEQVYSLITVENITSAYAPYSTRNGTIVGDNSGAVQNTFTTGHLLCGEYPYSGNVGPGIGSSNARNISRNNVFVQLTTYPGRTYYQNILQFEADKQVLSDQSWYDYRINKDGHFQTELVPTGYYPRVKMPECINNAQPLLQLPTITQAQQPELISASVVEELENSYRVEFSFTNPQEIKIGDIRFANRKITGSTYWYEQDVLTCDLLSQSMGEDKIYRVQALVSKPTVYRTWYYVTGFKPDLGSQNTQNWWTVNNPLKLEMPFYKPITNLDDWASISNDMYGNYRLVADLDFSRVPQSAMSKYVFSKPFYGKLDGSYMTESGEVGRHKIIGMEENPYNYVFQEVKRYDKNPQEPEISNLDIVNYKMADSKKVECTGWISIIRNTTVKNVHMIDSEITAGQSGGTLIGYSSYGLIENCSATNVKVKAMEYQALRLGGLIGNAENTTIQNCFVQGLDMEVLHGRNGYSGGMVGRMNNSSLFNAYVEGKIQTNFPNVGGISGYLDSGNSGRIKNAWSKVNITSVTGSIGGIVGAGSASNLMGVLSAGDIFTRSEGALDVNRIQGTGSYNVIKAAAFAGQFLEDGIHTEKLTDSLSLVTAEELKQDIGYTGTANMELDQFDADGSKAGDMQGIAQGYLPRLLSTEGKLLPHQTPVALTDTQMTLDVETLSVNSSAVADFQEMLRRNKVDPSGISYPSEAWSNVYRLKFTVNQASGYQVTGVSLEGMNLNDTFRISNTESISTYTEDQYSSADMTGRTYPFLLRENAYDRYRLWVTMTPKEKIVDGVVSDHSGDVLLSGAAMPDSKINFTISNARQWNEVMAEHKDDYANFLITGDIDGTDLPFGQTLITGIRANSLSSYTREGQQTYTIKNVELDIEEQNEAFIREVTSSVENLRFENITLRYKGAESSSFFGVIGRNNGITSKIDFSNITIEGNDSLYCGCIGYAEGRIEDINITDVKVSSRTNNLGGLVGYSKRMVSKVHAKGTLDASGNYNYCVKGGKYYVGGVVGQGPASYLYVDTILVEGGMKGQTFSQHGIAVGWGDINTSLTEADVTEETRSYVKNSKLIEYSNSSQIGGAAGNGYVAFMDVEDCRIQGPRNAGEDVGGVSGRGRITYCTSNRNVVIGNRNVGGAIGNITASENKETTISQCVVEGNDKVGGCAGYGILDMTKLEVRQTVISGTSNVGGLIGQQIQNSLNVGRVVNCEIYGTSKVGGVAGSTADSLCSIRQKGVIGTKIVAAKSTEGNSYAGGICGYGNSLQSFNSNYVDENTTLDANGDYVGGLIGYAEGGHISRSYSSAKINTNLASDAPIGKYVGGLIGGLASYNSKLDALYRITKLAGCYFNGTALGSDYVGGMVGVFKKGNTDTAPNRFTRDTAFGLVQAGDINLRNNAGGIIREDGNTENGASMGTIQNFRIYENSMFNGTVANDNTTYPHLEEQQKADKPRTGKGSGSSALAGGTSSPSIDYEQPMLVSANTLADPNFYTGKVEYGNLGWKISDTDNSSTMYGNWFLDNLIRMKAYPVRANLTNTKKLSLDALDPASLSNGEYQVSVLADASGYVVDGLKMHFDGIQNSRSGGHSDTANIWENIAPDGNAHYDLTANNLEIKAASESKRKDGWSNNSYSTYPGLKGAANWEGAAAKGERWEDMTMSITFMRTQGSGGYTGLMGFTNFNNETDSRAGIGFVNNTTLRTYGRTSEDTSIPNLSADGKMHNITCVWNYSERSRSLYLDGILVSKKNNVNTEWALDGGFSEAFHLIGIGNADSSRNGNTGYPLVGNIYNAKVYDRTLEAREVAQNYQADLKRFGANGNASTENAAKIGTAVSVYSGKVTFNNGHAEIDLSGSSALVLTQSSPCDLMIKVQADGEESQAVTGALYGAPISGTILPYESVTWSGDNETGIPTAEVALNEEFAGASCQWYRTDRPDYLGAVMMQGGDAQSQKAVLWGRGYYFCEVTASDGTVAYTPLIAVETDGFMPYIALRGATNVSNMQTWQEGYFTEPLDSHISLKLGTENDVTPFVTQVPELMQYSITPYPVNHVSAPDSWYSGGPRIHNDSLEILNLEIPDTTEQQSLALTGIPELTVYPSGVDCINIEADRTPDPACTLTVKDSKGHILTTGMEQQVYTLKYDFRSELTIQVGDSAVTKTYQVDPSGLRRSVMTEGDHYYYLSEGNIYSEELLVEGDYIHLYRGKALDSSGKILVLDETADSDTYPDALTDQKSIGGTEADSSQVSALRFVDTVPLERFSYSGTRIETYEHFSILSSLDAEEEGGMVREMKVVEKDGELYALDTQESISGSLITDTYQDQTWTMLLGEDGKAKSLADTMNWPSGVEKTGIAHTSNNLHCTEPWLLIRYASGYVKGFNYETGEELTLMNPKSDLSLIKYIGNFFSNKFESLKNEDDQAYLDLVSLKKQLTVHPLDESMIIQGSKVDEAGTSTDETEFATGAGDDKVYSGNSVLPSETVASPEKKDPTGQGMDNLNPGTAQGEASDKTAEKETSSSNIPDAPSEGGAETGKVETSATDVEEQKPGAEEAETTDADQKQETKSGMREENAANSAIKEMNGHSGKSAATGNGIVTEEPGVSETSGTGTTEEEVKGVGNSGADASESGTVADGSDASGNGTASEGSGVSGNSMVADGSGASGNGTANDSGVSGNGTAAEGSNASENGVAANNSGASVDGTAAGNGTQAETGVSGENRIDATDASKEKQIKEAKPASKTKYTYVYNAEKKSYDLYQTSELLDPKNPAPVSEQKKIQKLAAQGVMVNGDVSETKHTVPGKKDRAGMTLFVLAGAAAVGLAGLIIYRKRRY